MFAGIIGGAFLAMASHGADQIIVKTPAVEPFSSSKHRWRSSAAVLRLFAQMTLFLFVGLGLWVLYEGRPFPLADQIFPNFIIERMPHGLIGLIVAAIIAATMSTHSGAINALAASSTTISISRSPDEAQMIRTPPRWARCSHSAGALC